MTNMLEKKKSPAPQEFGHPIDYLKHVMACLRDPKSGCPWDKEQTFQTIVPHTIEEAYEVADAIERGDMKDLKEELGDLLFQVIYYAQMADEHGLFDFDDVAQSIADKMVFRHPHVFGEENAADAHDVNAIWDKQKDQEKAKQPLLDSVTKGLPALLRAQKLQKKAAKVGFEWPDTARAFDKIEEEIQELKEANTIGHQEEELGDLLFCLVNYARMNGLSSEEALRKANDKFARRFSQVETLIADNNQNFDTTSLEDMLDYWRQVKALNLEIK